jgi:hypothetical protein
LVLGSPSSCLGLQVAEITDEFILP